VARAASWESLVGGDIRDCVTIVMAIEDEFGIEISVEAMEHMNCIDDAVMYVKARLST
jgi:acyl carrier protein